MKEKNVGCSIGASRGGVVGQEVELDMVLPRRQELLDRHILWHFNPRV
jgi:hypothetical protein